MLKKNLLVAYRLFLALLALFAIAKQLSIHVGAGYSVVNFFSYFTNLSNLFASLVFIIAAFRLLQNRPPSAIDDLIRGSSVIAMVLVGIVYGVLLRGIDLGSLLPWINIVLHYVMPVAVVADWLYQPPRSKLGPKHIKYWLIFPALYLIYSIVRGALVGWYAYPFFDPLKSGGYISVTFYCLGILAVFFVMSWLLVKSSLILKRSIP